MPLQPAHDAVLVRIRPEQIEPCREAIRSTKLATWSFSHLPDRGALLIRRASPRPGMGAEASEELARALAHALAAPEASFSWGWSSGDRTRYFLTGEIYALIDGDLPAESRRNLLAI